VFGKRQSADEPQTLGVNEQGVLAQLGQQRANIGFGLGQRANGVFHVGLAQQGV
jgi:hypothetical protein